MKDKRLDALLATLPEMECEFYSKAIKICDLGKTNIDGITVFPSTKCKGDIRKCERKE